MSHITTFKLQAKPAKREAVLSHFDQWQRTLKAGATGFQSSSLVSSNENPDQITAIVRFDTTANYEKNSARPEIGAWFERLRADLIADPEWFNGTVARDNVS